MAIAMKPGFIHLKLFTIQITDLLLFLVWCFLLLLWWPVVIAASVIAGLVHLLASRRVFASSPAPKRNKLRLWGCVGC
jgi:hypothetical protein